MNKPTTPQRRWLTHGLRQDSGKLPLFDQEGQRISPRTVQACIKAGWVEPRQQTASEPDWLLCRLTSQGRGALDE